MEARQAPAANRRSVTRRSVLGSLGLVGLGLLAAACGSAPSAAPAPTTPPAKPTVAPAAKPSPATKPAATTAPIAKAPTAAPAAKRTFTPANVKIAYSTSPRVDSARLVGDKQGFFKDFGVELEVLKVSGTPDILRAAINNQVTFASGDIQTTLSAIDGGSPIKFLGTYEGKLGHIIFARPEIKTLKDLEGKSIGTTAVGSLIDNIEHEILKDAGVDDSKVEFVSLKGSAGIYQALVAGKIAAGAATDAYLPSARRDGLTILVKTWEALPNYVSSAFLATEQGIKENRDLIVRTLAGFAKTFRYLSDPSSKAVWVEVATSELKQEPEQAETAWQGIYEAKTLPGDLAFTKTQLDYLQQLNVAAGKQKAPLTFERAVDPSLAQEALKLL